MLTGISGRSQLRFDHEYIFRTKGSNAERHLAMVSSLCIVPVNFCTGKCYVFNKFRKPQKYRM